MYFVSFLESIVFSSFPKIFFRLTFLMICFHSSKLIFISLKSNLITANHQPELFIFACVIISLSYWWQLKKWKWEYFDNHDRVKIICRVANKETWAFIHPFLLEGNWTSKIILCWMMGTNSIDRSKNDHHKNNESMESRYK